VSARASLIESASQLYGQQQPLNFNSQLVKWNRAITDAGSSCSAVFLRTKDEGKLDYERGDVFRWSNFVIGGKCTALAQKGSLSFFDINLSVSNVSNEVGNHADPERMSSATEFNTQFNMVQILNILRLEYGFYTNLRWLNYKIDDLFTDINEEQSVLLGSGAYMQTTISLGDRLQLKPGASAAWYLFRYKVSLEPRMQVSWQP